MPALETKATGLVLLWQTKSVRHKGNEARPKVGPRQTLDRPTWQRINARQGTRKTVVPCAWQVKGESTPALETKATSLDLLCLTRPVIRLSSEVKPEAGPWRTLIRPTWQQINARKGSEGEA